MILSAQSIRHRVLNTMLAIHPFFAEKQVAHGMSFGLTSAGYDIRIGQIRQDRTINTIVMPPRTFLLASSYERIRIPDNLQVIVHDKSSWARQGLALQNTVLEPGWEGHITLELSNHGLEQITLYSGMPIAQLVFHMLDQPTDMPYRGKYQNQGPEPTKAIYEQTADEHLDKLQQLSQEMGGYEQTATTSPGSNGPQEREPDGSFTPGYHD